MKKLIVPIFAIATIFTSCTKDENPITKADIKTTSITTSFKESKGLSGKMAYLVGGTGVVDKLKDISFTFDSNVYSGYQATKFVDSTDTNSFTVDNVALGYNTLTVTAKTKQIVGGQINGDDGKKMNNFVTSYLPNEITNIQDFKNQLSQEHKPYLEYLTIQNENINLGGNNINVALQPVTGRIETAFRLSDSDITNGFTYTVEAQNSNYSNELFSGLASQIAHFESCNPTAKDGNSITYVINLYQNGNLLKGYTVTENFISGSSVNTVYFIDQNTINKDTATITLSINDLVDNDSDKPLD